MEQSSRVAEGKARLSCLLFCINLILASLKLHLTSSLQFSQNSFRNQVPSYFCATKQTSDSFTSIPRPDICKHLNPIHRLTMNSPNQNKRIKLSPGAGDETRERTTTPIRASSRRLTDFTVDTASTSKTTSVANITSEPEQTCDRTETPARNIVRPGTPLKKSQDINLVPDGDLTLVLARFKNVFLRQVVVDVLNTFNPVPPTQPKIQNIPDEVYVRVSAAKLVAASKAIGQRTKFVIRHDGSVAMRMDDDPGEVMLICMLAIFGFYTCMPKNYLPLEVVEEFLDVRDRNTLRDEAGNALRPPFRFAWKKCTTIKDIEDNCYIAWRLELPVAAPEESWLRELVFNHNKPFRMAGRNAPEDWKPRLSKSCC